MKTYPTPKSKENEDYRKAYEIFNEPISENNVKRMGELIALNALKYSAVNCGGYYEYLYKSLMKDVFNQNEKEHILSDGYDYAQEAIFFLCHFIGRNIFETYTTDKKGRNITIWLACARHVSSLIAADKRRVFKEETLDGINTTPEYKANNEIEKAQESVETTIRKMKLKKGEKEVLFCYMAGMTFVQIARYLGIDNSTVWHRRQRLQIKYMANIK